MLSSWRSAGCGAPTASTAPTARTFVDGPDGSSAFRDVPRFADPNAVAHAGSLLAPMPGTVVRVLAATGDAVTAGRPSSCSRP